MDASDFKHLIETDHYAPDDLEKVNDLCRNYPMFNLAHMLKVRIREALAYEKEKELKVAAVYAADRRKLFRMVTEVSRPEIIEEEPVQAEPEGIIFSDEPHPEVDVIIEQHAPYAGTEIAEDELLELDEDAEEVFSEAEITPETEITSEAEITPETEITSEAEITSATLIESVAKDEVEMEEPFTGEKTIPASEEVESRAEADPDPVSNPDAEAGEALGGNRLILSFLEEDPGPIRADKSTAGRKDVSLASIREHDGFITDTLAKIYVKQGLYAKAIYAYEKLSLKYPEKSAYFAAQIEKIGNINHS